MSRSSKLNQDHHHLRGGQAVTKPAKHTQAEVQRHLYTGRDECAFASPSFSKSSLLAWCIAVERLTGYVTSNNRFIYVTFKLHIAAQTNRQETCLKEKKWKKKIKIKESWERVWKSRKILRQQSEDIAFPPGNHPGYQVEVIMLWSTNEFIR